MTATAMVPDAFRDIIDQNCQSSNVPDTRLDNLRTALSELSLCGIIAFEVAFRGFLNQLYTWDIWGAAYVIHGGCSDDSFEYFRRWLVSRGRRAYEAAMADADSLADLELEPLGPDEVWEFEAFYYVAVDVFEEKGGEGDVRDHSEHEAGLSGPAPSGEPFDEHEEQLAKRYPKLWQRFGEEPLG